MVELADLLDFTKDGLRKILRLDFAEQCPNSAFLSF